LRSGEAKDFGSESTIPRIEQLLLVGTSASPARLLDMGLAQSLLMLNGRHLRTFSQHSLHKSHVLEYCTSRQGSGFLKTISKPALLVCVMALLLPISSPVTPNE